MAKEENKSSTSDSEAVEPRTKKGRPKDHLPERQKYEMLCRGEGVKMVSALHTLYTSHNIYINIYTLPFVWDALSNPYFLFLFQTPRRQKKLFCRYHDGNRSPVFILSPTKQEDEWDKPRIVRFHDIISDEEIEKVKEIAKPRVSGLLHGLYL